VVVEAARRGNFQILGSALSVGLPISDAIKFKVCVDFQLYDDLDTQLYLGIFDYAILYGEKQVALLLAAADAELTADGIRVIELILAGLSVQPLKTCAPVRVHNVALTVLKFQEQHNLAKIMQAVALPLVQVSKWWERVNGRIQIQMPPIFEQSICAFLAQPPALADLGEAIFGAHWPDAWDDAMQVVGQPSRVHPEGEVIQEISHDEPAAVRDEEAASLAVGTQTDEDIAAFVERRLGREDGHTEYAQPSNKVHLVSFRSGDGELFRTMLLKDSEFRPLRKIASWMLAIQCCSPREL